MTRINSYLSFNGNCREAMNFYKECLGGELNVQTIGESPMADQLPRKMKDNILHSTLVKDELVLMGTDMVSEEGLTKGNGISLMLHCSNEEEIRNYYQKLCVGGEATHPPHDTFWGALIGDLKDKFGNNWILHFDKNTTPS